MAKSPQLSPVRSQRTLGEEKSGLETDHRLCLRSFGLTPDANASLLAFDRYSTASANDVCVDKMQSRTDEQQFYIKKTGFP